MSAEFISVSTAKALINEHIETIGISDYLLTNAIGLVLAEDVYSKCDSPPFNQSSMDGYAISFKGWKQNGDLQISNTSPAGPISKQTLKPNQAIRIFTGAAVPDGADTVVMQEKVAIKNGLLRIKDPNLETGMNFRAKGAEFALGDLILEKGSKLTAAALGFLASAGIDQVKVFPNPSISIILTGNELQKPGLPLSHGQVYESNSYTLSAALRQVGISNITVASSEDKLETLIKVLKEAIKLSDVVLLTGGVSVGDYDFVIQAAKDCGVEQIFHKIKQRPGKPLYFGKFGRKAIFGLPGNPASVLTCFYEYVLPALGKMSKIDRNIKKIHVPLGYPLSKPLGLTQFIRAHYDGQTLSGLKGQESFRLSSFAHANCLIQLDEEKTEFKEDDIVEVHLLPQ